MIIRLQISTAGAIVHRHRPWSSPWSPVISAYGDVHVRRPRDLALGFWQSWAQDPCADGLGAMQNLRATHDFPFEALLGESVGHPDVLRKYGSRASASDAGGVMRLWRLVLGACSTPAVHARMVTQAQVESQR